MRPAPIVTESVVWVGWYADDALCALTRPISRSRFEILTEPRLLVWSPMIVMPDSETAS